MSKGLRLQLAYAITEPVGCDEKEDLKLLFAVLIDAKVGVNFLQTVCLQLGKSSFRVIDFKEASLLSWIASVLSEPDLNLISSEGCAFVWRVAA